ncbi:MAG: aldo/keto reductase [Oscillospiraceae bacterium]|nr:aldo/keto reductase [Oscillospiraceae bacterium]
MKKIRLQNGMDTPAVIMGCMRLNQLSPAEGAQLIAEAYSMGVNLFDHADIYGKEHGCEEAFARAFALSGLRRQDVLLQSKCGIRPCGYDFSAAHIIRRTEESLKALKTDYLDLLLLHRPDTLMEPEETAEALLSLKKSGKVRAFGVSNHNALQIELLQRALGGERLQVNQMQLSLAHTPLIDHGMAVNMDTPQSVGRAGGCLEYCRLENIRLQAWSPLQKGFFGGVFLNDPAYGPLNEKLAEVASAHGVGPAAAAIAWICRHPAGVGAVLGTTNVQHFKEAAAGGEIELTREEWYGLYRAAGNNIP